jgi:NADPH:quinone reductase-like Zn-dependent oxidoreductase
VSQPVTSPYFRAAASKIAAAVRAIVVHETGGPEVLRLEEVDDPGPGEGEVLVQVEAAGVNHFDVNQRAGGARNLPYTPGSDAGGRLEDGTRVLLTSGRGCYAEVAVAKESSVWRIPDAVSSDTAAALGVPYRTAWWALVDLAGLQSGDRLLVQAGSSGTGQAAIQIGLVHGARVYATAGSSKHDRLRQLGAEPLSYEATQLAELEADVVFDPVGGDGFSSSVASLARDGRLVTPGAVASPAVSFDLWTLVGKRARIIGTGSAPAARETLDRIVALAAEAKLDPVIDRRLPLAEAAEAHRLIEAREVFGKVVLVP